MAALVQGGVNARSLGNRRRSSELGVAGVSYCSSLTQAPPLICEMGPAGAALEQRCENALKQEKFDGMSVDSDAWQDS